MTLDELYECIRKGSRPGKFRVHGVWYTGDAWHVIIVDPELQAPNDSGPMQTWSQLERWLAPFL